MVQQLWRAAGVPVGCSPKHLVDPPVHEPVEAHTGTIEVQSAVGSGTEFQVTLPLPEK